jgi:hypothetical protein
MLNEYISGNNLKSWCVLGPGRRPIEGWADIQAEDHPRLFS